MMEEAQKKEFMLTTIDNPFNPFQDFDSWLMFDKDNNHNCCELVDRFSFTSDQFTDQENENEIQRAIDEIIENDLIGIYKRVFPDEVIIPLELP